MSDLGTLSAHHLRPGARRPEIGHFVRQCAGHQLRPGARRIPAEPPPYLADFAHYPVRLNGRAHNFYSGASGRDGPPWTLTPQTINDANGRRFWHPHSECLIWAAGAGARAITAHVRHTFTTGPLPQLRIPARPDLGLPELIATAGATTDTDHELALSFTLPAAATLFVFLENPNFTLGPYTTWGDILTE